MTDHTDQLIELYKAARSELHHHDTVYIQVCAAMAIALTFFIGAISVLFGQLKLDPAHIGLTKWAILILAAILSAIFFQQIWRSDGRIKACRDVTKRIERRLSEGTSEFNGLLVGGEVDSNRRDTGFWARYKFWFYAALTAAALGALGYFLFGVVQV